MVPDALCINIPGAICNAIGMETALYLQFFLPGTNSTLSLVTECRWAVGIDRRIGYRPSQRSADD